MDTKIITRAEAQALGVMSWNELTGLAWRQAVHARLIATVISYEPVVVQSEGFHPNPRFHSSPMHIIRVSFSDSDGDARFTGVVAEDRFEGVHCGCEVLMCCEARSGDGAPSLFISAITPLSAVSVADILNNRDFDPSALQRMCQP
jgi:hypothetical protein